MKKTLKEMLNINNVVVDGSNIVIDNMISQWGAVQCAPLSVILVHLKFLNIVHQTHHWTAKGDSFYGDHLLFQRLYEGTNSEIDSIAEKAVGLGSIENVNLKLVMTQVMQLVQTYASAMSIPQASELAKKSLAAEMCFIQCVKRCVEVLKESSELTSGVDNMLAGFVDAHESNVYLLKQRCTQ